jgi:hypothetical protein
MSIGPLILIAVVCVTQQWEDVFDGGEVDNMMPFQYADQQSGGVDPGLAGGGDRWAAFCRTYCSLSRLFYEPSLTDQNIQFDSSFERRRKKKIIIMSFHERNTKVSTSSLTFEVLRTNSQVEAEDCAQ